MATTHLDPLSRAHGGFADRKPRAADDAAISRAFMAYVGTFGTLNPRAALRHLHVPFVFFDGRDMHVVSSTAEVEALRTRVMGGLIARGYARSDIEELWVYRMSQRAALVTVARARYDATGKEIDCVGETYTMLRDADADGEWRIAIAVVHDAENVLRARQRWRRD